MGVHINEGSWPLLMLTPRGSKLGEAALLAALASVDRLARAAGEIYAQIWDLRGVGMLGALQREPIAELASAHAREGLLAGCVIIPGKTFVDGFSTEAFWAEPPAAYEVATFPDMGAAMHWAAEVVETRRKKPIPDSIRDMRTQKLPVVDDDDAGMIERAPRPGDIILRAPGSGRSPTGFAALMKLRWSEQPSFLAPADEEHADPVTWTGPFEDEAEAERVREHLEALDIALVLEHWPE